MKQPIRILQLGMTNNPGGVENFVMNIYRNIDRNKIQFDFLLDHNAPKIAYEDEILSLGGKIYRQYYRRKEFFKKERKSIKYFFKMHPEIKGVHMHANTLNPMFKVLQVAEKMKIPVRILHSHNSNYMKKPKIKDKIYEMYESKKLKNTVTKLLACSEEAGKWMFKKNKFFVVKNGINVKDFAFDENERKALRKKFSIENKLVIGHIGRMNYQKNPIFILEIFDEIHKMNNDTELLYIGDGELKGEIEKFIKDKNLESSVILMGKCEKVSEYYNVMDAFLFPSRFEGLGIVLLEAQANGIKCYTSNRVPKETNIVGNVSYIELNKSSKEWADFILNNKNERTYKNITDKFVLSGYDIKSTVLDIEKMYLEGVNKC